jgi:hypothetical protein
MQSLLAVQVVILLVCSKICRCGEANQCPTELELRHSIPGHQRNEIRRETAPELESVQTQLGSATAPCLVQVDGSVPLPKFKKKDKLATRKCFSACTDERAKDVHLVEAKDLAFSPKRAIILQ